MTLSPYQRKTVDHIEEMRREGLPIDDELKKLPPKVVTKLHLAAEEAATPLKTLPKPKTRR
jgi:hypothetical protein